MKMLFCEESDLKLMALVKENSMLYDRNHPNYRDFDAKAVVWQRISDELQRSVKDCKLRWLHIRDAYRRLSKLRIKSGRGKPYKYENSISFIRPFLEKDVFKDEPYDDYDNISYDCDYGNKGQRSGKPKKKRKADKRKREFVDVQEFKTLNSSSEFDKIDSVDAFLFSIGATLKTFSPYHLNIAKTKIFSIVQEHDLQQIVQQQEEDKTTKS